MGLFNKKELKRIEELEKENAEYLSKIEQLGAKELFDIQNEIKELQKTKLDVEKDIQEILIVQYLNLEQKKTKSIN